MRQGVLISAVLVVLTSNARAHLELLTPSPRHSPAEQKRAPCGATDDARGENLVYARPGDTLALTWDEYIPHPGYFRISFDDDGQDDFVEPADYDDLCTGGSVASYEAGYVRCSDTSVLIDGIGYIAPGEYLSTAGVRNFSVTLPEIECDSCTLQVVQFMTDKPPYEVGGNDLYYACVDLVLTWDAFPVDQPVPPNDDDDGPEDDPPVSGACQSGSKGGPLAWSSVILVVVFASRWPRSLAGHARH